jgi:putative flippase GtrA
MFVRFLLVGSLGFVIDAGLTYLLVQVGIAPWLARFPAIGLAMAFTWLANRNFTYRVRAARSAEEAMRYALVAASTASINYLIYLALVSNGAPPVAAVTVATLFQTVISYYCYRRFVFRKCT